MQFDNKEKVSILTIKLSYKDLKYEVSYLK